MRYEGDIKTIVEIEKLLRQTVPFHLVDKGEGRDVFGNNGRPSQLQVLVFHIFDERDLYYFKIRLIFDHRAYKGFISFAERDGGRIFRTLPDVVKLMNTLTFCSARPELRMNFVERKPITNP